MTFLLNYLWYFTKNLSNSFQGNKTHTDFTMFNSILLQNLIQKFKVKIFYKLCISLKECLFYYIKFVSEPLVFKM